MEESWNATRDDLNKFSEAWENLATGLGAILTNERFPEIRPDLDALVYVIKTVRENVLKPDAEVLKTPKVLFTKLTKDATMTRLTLDRMLKENSSESRAPELRTQITRLQAYVPIVVLLDFWTGEGSDFHKLDGRVSLLQGQLDGLSSRETQASNSLAAIEKVKLRSEAAYERIEALEVDTTNLVNLKAGKLVNDDFASRAAKEAKEAKWWTRATAALATVTLFGLIALVVLAYLGTVDINTTNWGMIAAKVLAIATLGFITRWCSKRANHHIQEEARYHRLAVNLSAVNPFVSARLEKENAESVLKEVALKTFANDTTPNSDMSYDSSTIDILSKSIADQLAKIKTG